ncbi:hypothetical protein TNCV_3611181 [Trichonephila clavipes]|nr:hypothetical protein TNCV_3611181 [Trichonephila clavipes]
MIQPNFKVTLIGGIPEGNSDDIYSGAFVVQYSLGDHGSHHIERGLGKNIFERHRNANPTLTTSHDASQPTVTEEPYGETSMEIPLPKTPQASRPGTPEDFGPTFENCRKLQGYTTIIDLYSTTQESRQLLLKGVMQSGIKDPNNPIIRKETSYMELTNERLQQAVSEYASLPPCDNPNYTRHTSNNSPA